VTGPVPVEKAESVVMRLALWRQSARLIGDHPLGCGSGHFLHAFLPYQLADPTLRSETLVFASPHNEYLRVLTEEGVLWCAIATYLLARLLAALGTRLRSEREPSSVSALLAGGAAFLAVESAFQFPFGLAFGALAAALLLGVAWSALSETPWTISAGEAAPLRTRIAAFLAAALVVALAARVAASDVLTATAPERTDAQDLACALDPGNLRGCLLSAWHHVRAGQRRQARARLFAVLERSPYYGPAIKLLGEEELAAGHRTTGCFHLWIYDRLHGHRSSARAALVAACEPGVLESFRRRVSVPGYQRFPAYPPSAGEER
jgi:hypothetical protein